jgi:hypothetical protein
LTLVGDVIGISDGGPCPAVTEYFTAIGDGAVATAARYKFGGTGVPQWADRLGRVDSVTCTCTDDLSDRTVQRTDRIPDTVSNVTDAQLVFYTIEGTYRGEPATLKGTAFTFRPVSTQWYIDQELPYELNGQRLGAITVADTAPNCTP